MIEVRKLRAHIAAAGISTKSSEVEAKVLDGVKESAPLATFGEGEWTSFSDVGLGVGYAISRQASKSLERATEQSAGPTSGIVQMFRTVATSVSTAKETDKSTIDDELLGSSWGTML